MSNTVEIVIKLKDELTGKLSVQKDKMTEWNNVAAKMAKVAAQVGVAIAGAVTALTAFLDRITRSAAEMTDIVAPLGMTVEEYDALAFVVQQAGGNASNLPVVFQRMRVAISEAADAATPAAEALRDLGLSQQELLEMSALEQYHTIVGAIASMENSTLAAAHAQDLLGRGAVQLRGALTLTADQMIQAEAAARDLGVVISDEAAEGADRFQDALSTVRDRLNASLVEGVQPLLPDLIELLNILVDGAERVIPAMVDGAEEFISVVTDLAEAVRFVVDRLEEWRRIQNNLDPTADMSGWERIANAVLPGLGTNLHLASDAVNLLDDSTEQATESQGRFWEALETVRNAADRARVALEGQNEELERQAAIEAARREKKGRPEHEEEGGGYGGAATPSPEELKNERVKEQIQMLREMNEERLQAELDRIAEIEEAERELAEQRMQKAQAAKALQEAQWAAERQREQERMAALQQNISRAAQFGFSLYAAAQEGKRGLKQWADNFLAELERVVMTEVFKTVLQLLLGGFNPGGLLGDVFGGLFHSGGVVRAQSGYVVPGSGRGDHVPILAEPGEVVLSRDAARELRRTMNAPERAARPVTLIYQPTIGTGTPAELARAARELGRLIRREGL